MAKAGVVVDLAELLMAYLQWHFSDSIGDFHVGDDILVSDVAEARDGNLAVTLLLPDGDTREVILSARTANEGGGCS